nr:PAS domain S-box protein [Desulfurispira natronophila]
MFRDHNAIMLLIDPRDGSIFDANHAAATFYGYQRSDMRQMNIEQINTLTPEEVQQEWSLAEQENRNYFLFRHRLASGEVRPVEVYSSLVEVNGKNLLYSIIHDISQREELNVELAQSETRLRYAEQVAGIGHWTLDLQAMEYQLSQGSQELLQIPYESIFYEELKAKIPQHYQKELSDSRQKLIEEGIPYNTTFAYHLPSSDKLIYLNTHARYDAASHSLFGIIHDITDFTNVQQEQQRQRIIFTFLAILVIAAQLAIILFLVHMQRQKKQAQARLQEREAKLSGLIQSIHDQIFITDEEGKVTEYYIADPQELIIKPQDFMHHHFSQFLPPNVSDLFEHAIRKILEEGEPQQLEYQLTNDDKKRFYSALVSEMRTINNTTKGFIAVVRDITKRAEAQSQLQQRERQLRSLLENTPDLIMRFNSQGRLTYHNPSVSFLFANNLPKYLGGTSCDEDIEMCDLLQEGVADVFAKQKPVTVELSHRGIFGMHHFECRITPELDDAGNFSSVLAISRDITERRENEQELLRAHNFYLTMLDDFPTLIWRTNTENTCDYLNTTWLEFTGCSFNDNSHDAWLRNIHPDDTTRCRQVRQHAFQARERYQLEYRLQRHDCEYAHMWEIGRPIYDLSQRYRGFIGSCHDLTEQRRSEEQLAEKDRLILAQSRQAAMGEMIGNIAHQWRQPLTSLSTTIEEIQDAKEYGELSDEYFQELSNKAHSAIEFMSRTIDDFRNFFQPDKEKRTFNIAEVVQDAINIVEASFANNGISLKFSSEDAPIGCLGYPNEYAQVVLNIFSNAKDILLERKIADPQVHIHLHTQQDYCRLCIEDNGGGIPPEHIPHIFEPYFTTKEQGKGTGIGLYMSKNIVESMNGTLKVHNTKQGACFTIELKCEV